MEDQGKYKKVTQEMRLRLRAPLPADAVKQNPSKTFLSTIKPIYVTERLNEVFGVGAWQIRTELVNPVASEAKESKSRKYTEFTALMKTSLTIPEYGIYYECIAGSSNEDEGDSTKGGTTDGITKIASWMEIGINVFKGLGNVATEASIEEGLEAMLKAQNREDVAKVWKQYPHLRAVESFKNATRLMSAQYPEEAPEQPKNEPEMQEAEVVGETAELASEKQLQLLFNLAASHHIKGDLKQHVQQLKERGDILQSEASKAIDALQEMIGKGGEYEKTTPATDEQVKLIGDLLYNELFTDEERKKGFDKLQKGYSIAQARNAIAKLTEAVETRKKATA